MHQSNRSTFCLPAPTITTWRPLTSSMLLKSLAWTCTPENSSKPCRHQNKKSPVGRPEIPLPLLSQADQSEQAQLMHDDMTRLKLRYKGCSI